MGSRLLAEWLANPLIDVPAIQARQEAVAELVADPALADHLHDTCGRSMTCSGSWPA